MYIICNVAYLVVEGLRYGCSSEKRHSCSALTKARELSALIRLIRRSTGHADLQEEAPFALCRVPL